MRVIVCASIWPENPFCGGDGSPNKPPVVALCVVRACRGMERLIKLRMVFSSLKRAKTFSFPSSCWLAVVWQKPRELGGRDGGSGADRRLLCLSPVVVQSLSRVRLSATPWTAAHLASLSFTISRSLLKLMSIESVMPSNCLFLCRPLLLRPSVFPSFRIFSHKSALHFRCPKYWSFSFSISSSNIKG